jgi:hypothetical protein
MSPLFDEVRPEPQHEVVAYWNAQKRQPAFDGVPAMDNEQPFAGVLRHLASGRGVVTNSYHGVYWATLLGRPVVVWKPYSVKFHRFKHPPMLCEPGDGWRTMLNKALVYPEALEECRAANRLFYAAVVDRYRRR